MFDLRHAVVFGYAALALLFWAIWKRPPDDSGEMASWVQGVGTIMGVFAAIFAGFWPVEAARRSKVAQELAFGEALETARSAAFITFSTALRGVENLDADEAELGARVFRRTGGDKLLRSLLAEPVSKWPDPALFFLAHNFGEAVEGFAAAIEQATKTAGVLSRSSPPTIVAIGWESLKGRARVLNEASDGLATAIGLFSKARR